MNWNRRPEGPYAGAVGYFGFNGNMDFCITIRTMVRHKDLFSFQVGAGIVADSDPESEYQETLNKAGAMFQAIREDTDTMILMIDNYDSFTYNLVQMMQIMGQDIAVRRNNQGRYRRSKSLEPRGPGDFSRSGNPR
jgi:hypothetical protein